MNSTVQYSTYDRREKKAGQKAIEFNSFSTFLYIC